MKKLLLVKFYRSEFKAKSGLFAYDHKRKVKQI